MDHTKVPLALVKRQKWDTYCKTIVGDCAYACAHTRFNLNELTTRLLLG